MERKPGFIPGDTKRPTPPPFVEVESSLWGPHESNAPQAQDSWGSVEALAALDAEAVPSEVVVSTRSADEPAGWVRLEPSLALPAVPDPIFRTKHPAASFAVEDREIADRKPERAWHQPARPALLHEEAISDLGLGERIDSHAESIARDGPPGSGRSPGSV